MNKRKNTENTVEDQRKNETPLAKGLGVFEIAEDTTIEEMKAIFWDNETLIAPTYKLFQLNSHGKRYYYFVNDAGEPVFMPSVTTILSETMPENPFLTDWKLSLGKEKAEAYTAERASYGTFMHACFEELIINRSFNLDGLRGKLAQYMVQNKLPDKFMNYAEDLKRDLLSFAAWIREYDVRPIAIEVSLFHPELGYAGMVDLVASVRNIPVSEDLKILAKAAEKLDKDLNKSIATEEKAVEKAGAEMDKAVEKAKGDEEKIEAAREIYRRKIDEAEEARKLADKDAKKEYLQVKRNVKKHSKDRSLGIIDFKSGRKGFYEEHQHQLNLYSVMWNANFPKFPVSFIANFSPKEWRKTPAYNYKIQDGEQPIEKTMLLLALFKANGKSGTDKNVTVISGTIDLDKPFVEEENISVISFEELVVSGRRRSKKTDNLSAETENPE